MPKAAVLQQESGSGKVRCLACEHRCSVPVGAFGRCRAYFNSAEEGLLELGYHAVHIKQVEPVERMPSRLFQPGTSVLCIGGPGCNMGCPHCWNDTIAWAQGPVEVPPEKRVEPEDVVAGALNAGVQGIAGDYNEASIAVGFWRDIFTLAHEAGLYTALVTNGYSSPEALEILLPLTDLYRVDFKAWTQSALDRQALGCRVEVPFRSALQAKKAGCFVVCVTAIIPTLNDGPSEIGSIARWIAKNLGRETPYILTGYTPAGVRTDIPALNDQSNRLGEFRQLARHQGLANVF